jgi:hydrogenase maturation protease
MKVLVAGVGNLLFGDDGFGLAVIERLASNRLPSVRLMSAGVRGFDLASALLDGYDGAILVDAVTRGGSPGTLYVLEPDAAKASAQGGLSLDVDAHAFEPARPGSGGRLETRVGAHRRLRAVAAHRDVHDAESARRSGRGNGCAARRRAHRRAPRRRVRPCMSSESLSSSSSSSCSAPPAHA